MRLSTRFAGAFGPLPVAAFAPRAAAVAARTITVNWRRRSPRRSEPGALSAGVTTTAATAAAALSENATQDDSGVRSAQTLGVPEKDIQTSNFSVSPQYRHTTDTRSAAHRRLSGFGNQVDLTLDDVKKLGPALDALVAVGRQPDQLRRLFDPRRCARS